MLYGDQSKRRLGDIWGQLVLSACVLLAPPLVMAAGVIYLGSPSGAAQQIGAERADKLATSLALLSAEQRPVIDEPRSVAQPPPSTQKQITKDSARYSGRNTVDGSGQSPTVEAETLQAAALADLSSKVPEQLPTERPRLPARSATPYVRGTVAAVEEANPTSSAHPGTNEGANWVVQLSAQRTEGEAETAFRAAQAKYSALAGHQLLIRRKDQGVRGVFYAAQVGPLTRVRANEICDNIKSAGGSCFIQAN